MKVQIVQSDEQILLCFPVLLELRPKLVEGAFVARVRRQEKTGYRLAYLEDAGQVVTAAGFRVLETLVNPRSLHIDDLVTRSSARSKGYGAALLRWLRELAIEEACGSIQLDSSHVRKDAHRFYEQEGMLDSGLHFQMMLGERPRPS